jgi:hypothetical protein
MKVGTHYILALESVLALGSIMVALRAPAFAESAIDPMARILRRLAVRPHFAIWVVALLPCLLRFALLPWMPVPQPAIQEEFSYLMQGETFAHGHIVNPTSPMAVFFDVIENVQYPHYESVRPPAQGAFLALGDLLFHQPWLGVCLSVSLMCAAFYWMLLGWTRPWWALLTALLFGLRFGVFSFWMNSYWGGAPAVLGGALVLGAVPRIMGIVRRGRFAQLKTPRLRDTFWFSLGCGLLATTRPYEGAFFLLPVIVALIIWWSRSPDRAIFRVRTVHAVLPVLLMGLLEIAGLAYLNFVMTGSPTKFAYAIWIQQSTIVPNFLWQHLGPLPTYYSIQSRQFKTVWEVKIYRDLHTTHLRTAWLVLLRYLAFLNFHVRPLLALPLVFWPNPRKGQFWDREYRIPWLAFFTGILALQFTGSRHQHQSQYIIIAFAVLLCVCWLRMVRNRMFLLPSTILLCGIVSAMFTTFWMMNYDPMYSVVLYLFIAEGMRRIYIWRRGRREGAAIVRNLMLSCAVIAVLLGIFTMLRIHVGGENPFRWSSYKNRLQDRARIAAWLAEQPGKQLAIVRYGPNHEVLYEWVFNGADLENGKVLWARELRPDWEAALVRHYKDRHIWLVEPDANPVRIEPYPVKQLPPAVPDSALPIPGR